MQDQEMPFKFTGSGGEYFRIWIVNLLLTILTLGIYSPWAKVRRLQYFYRNTQLNNTGFDYHGTAIAILKGRLIAIALFASYYITIQVAPIAGLLIGLAIALIMPYLLVISFRFRLYNSSYCGLRFGFFGSVKSAYFTFLALPIFTLLTLNLLAPFTHQRIKAYQHNNSRFGLSNFSFNASAGSFYGVYIFTLLPSMLIIGFLGFMLARAFKSGAPNPGNPALAEFAIVAILLFIMASMFIVPYFISRIQNLIWNNTKVGDHGISSTLSARGLWWIMFSNFILTILTIGLFKPYADVRMARYRIENMALIPAGNLDSFIASEQQQAGAVGTETAELFDVDIGF
jgi:uncharacterized membrane protein YjgN (DUF898 family)